MTEIIVFKPKKELSSESNLKEFISHCRNKLSVFGRELVWEHTSWPKQVNFTKLGVKSRGWGKNDAFDSNFIDFAKAYYRYQQGIKPTKTRWEAAALRVLEKAFLENRAISSICNLSPKDFDLAATFASSSFSESAKYHVGRELARLTVFLNDNQMLTNPFMWESPIKRPKDRGIAIGKAAIAQSYLG